MIGRSLFYRPVKNRGGKFGKPQSGYEDAAPVRIGNSAADQLQLDVYGEVLDALYQARRMGLAPSEAAWNLERELVEHLQKIWELPDEGLWEVRGGRRQLLDASLLLLPLVGFLPR
jgi:GH15 family glucan-1,4-alpha-glucosidase